MENNLLSLDKTKKFSLLPNVSSFNPRSLKREDYIHPSATQKTAGFTLTNLLSSDECEGIMKVIQTKEFHSLEGSYFKDFRDSSRQCVLDKDFSKLLWKRLSKELRKDHSKINYHPIGFNISGLWEPHSVNDCFRISKYEENSKGFQAHFDTQFTTSFENKSIFSVVIYLNDDYVGGETTIYEEQLLDVDKEIIEETFEGITVKEEIKKVGGIEKYKKHTINPKQGKAFIFSHQLLHQGEPVKKGTKYIIRTDIVFQKKLTITSNFSSKLFETCTKLFREAQNQELQMNKEKSNELYEKSLSIRRYVSKHDRLVSKDLLEDFLLMEDCWMTIISFIHLDDYLDTSVSCKTIYNYCASYKQELWSKLKKDYFSNETISNVSNEKFCFEKSRLFIPELTGRHTDICLFEYKNRSPEIVGDDDFFQRNLQACLRVVSMYALANFGTIQNSKNFIAQYFPENGMIKKCSLEWFLTCAFYELPCYGCFYSIPESNECDISKPFDKMKPGGPYIETPFGYDKYGKSDKKIEDYTFNENFEEISLKRIPKRIYSSDGEEEEEEGEVSNMLQWAFKDSSDDEEEFIETNEERRVRIQKLSQEEKQRIKEIKQIRSEQAVKLFNTFVDRDHLKTIYQSENDDSMHISEYIDNPEDYQKELKTIGEFYKPGYSTINYQKGTLVEITCACGVSIEPEGVFRQVVMNNLICDFQNHKISISKYDNTDPKHEQFTTFFNFHPKATCYVADIQNLKDLNGFHHAGCNCGPKDKKVTNEEEFHGIKFKQNNYVTLIGIVIASGKKSTKITTKYYGVGSF